MGIAAIGDIHGDRDKLERMLTRPELVGRLIVFLGDLVNRGPDSRGVLDLVFEATLSRGAVTLLGNHDAALLNYLESGDFVRFAAFGGLPTLRSYLGEARGDVFAAFLAAFPPHHRNLLESSATHFETGDVLFTHAGVEVHPDGSWVLADGRNAQLLTRPLVFPKLCVCGHYVQPAGRPFVSPGLICVDTGCGSGGPLTAVLLPERSFVQIN